MDSHLFDYNDFNKVEKYYIRFWVMECKEVGVKFLSLASHTLSKDYGWPENFKT